MDIKQMQEMANNYLVQADSIQKKYDGKPQDLKGTELAEVMSLTDAADDLAIKIEATKKLNRLQKWSEEAATSPLPMGGGGGSAPEGRIELTDKEAQTKSIRSAWGKYIKGGMFVLKPDEVKAYQADNPVGGGFLVAPQDFVREIILLVKDLVFLRQMGTVYTVDRAESLGIPAMDTDPSDADWTAELLTGGTESTMAFGKRELRPHPVAKNVQVSNKLLRNTAMNAESIVMDRMAYKMGVTQEKAFLTGTGADQPLGVYTASSQGIPTTRDVTAATTTAVAGDDFIKTKYALKAQYQKNASWIMHRDVVSAARRLKDSNNNYLWTAGLTAWGGSTGPGNGLQGTPERMLDCPIAMSEYSPNTFTTGLYMAILGDFKHYYIADALEMQWSVLDQLYAATNQTGYIARSEVDAMPVLAEAFSRLILQ